MRIVSVLIIVLFFTSFVSSVQAYELNVYTERDGNDNVPAENIEVYVDGELAGKTNSQGFLQINKQCGDTFSLGLTGEDYMAIQWFLEDDCNPINETLKTSLASLPHKRGAGYECSTDLMIDVIAVEYGTGMPLADAEVYFDGYLLGKTDTGGRFSDLSITDSEYKHSIVIKKKGYTLGIFGGVNLMGYLHTNGFKAFYVLDMGTDHCSIEFVSKYMGAEREIELIPIPNKMPKVTVNESLADYLEKMTGRPPRAYTSTATPIPSATPTPTDFATSTPVVQPIDTPSPSIKPECGPSEIYCEYKNECVKSPLECYEEYKIYSYCTTGWPAHEGDSRIMVDNNGKELEKIYSCDLFEVKDTSIRKIAAEAVECCLTNCGGACHSSCSSNYRDSFLSKGKTHARIKSCAARYLIDALGPRERFMYDYYFPELFCVGFPGMESAGWGGSWDCGHYNPGWDVSSLTGWISTEELANHRYPQAEKMSCKRDTGGSPAGWISDTDMSKNSCVLSNLPAHASLTKLKTGTCYDYSSALTTILRMVGFSDKEVYTISGGMHTWNVIKFPGDHKWTFVDTTGNKAVPMIWHGLPALNPLLDGYCKLYESDNCDNDRALGMKCPPKSQIWGCN